MKCAGSIDGNAGNRPVRMPCPNVARYQYGERWVCFAHRPDLREIRRCQRAVLWLLWGVTNGTV